jgi:O-methyltransferase involved in polyketide biosynthesis
MSMESKIQSTCDDAMRAKAAAVNAGYYKDPFLAGFPPDSRTVQPIIKRGTFARIMCVDRAISSFLRLCSEKRSQHPQIVVLGAGKDTSFFRLQAGLLASDTTPKAVKWIEVDYESVVSAKVERIIRKEDVFHARVVSQSKQGVVTMAARIGANPWQGSYQLVPHDLNGCTNKLSELLHGSGLDCSIPTLFVLECCLMYLPQSSTQKLLKGIAEFCGDDGCICMYEPLLGDDPFGKVMERNLTTAGVACDESTLVQTRTLTRQMDNLSDAGFKVITGCDMWAAFETVLTDEQRRHANRCEFLDEIEEWILIMKHYCFVVASVRSSEIGRTLCSVGESSCIGFDAGRCGHR